MSRAGRRVPPGATAAKPGRRDDAEPARAGPPRAGGWPAGNAAAVRALGSDAASPETRDPGMPLGPGVRAQAERAYGTDLSGVRVHSGPAAREAAHAVGARAYTVGEHVVLGAQGDRSLMHELAHVVQQRLGGPPPAAGTGAAHEHAAAHAATAALSGAAGVAVGPGTGVGLARAPEDEEPEDPEETPEEEGPAKQSAGETPARVFVGPGHGSRVRSGYKRSPMPEVIKTSRMTPRPPLTTPLTGEEQRYVVEAAVAEQRLGRPMVLKTKAAALTGPVVRSGYGQHGGATGPGGGGAAATAEVMRVAAEIGHDLAVNSSLDGGIPGQEKASHAEKQKAVTQPGAPLAVDEFMCPDCFAFFRKLAQHRQVPLVVKEPNLTWVFRTDGVAVGRNADVSVILHPDGRTSAGPPAQVWPKPGPPKGPGDGGAPGAGGSPGPGPAPGKAGSAAAKAQTAPNAPAVAKPQASENAAADETEQAEAQPGQQPAQPQSPAAQPQAPPPRPQVSPDERIVRRLDRQLTDARAEATEAGAALEELEKAERETGLTPEQAGRRDILRARAAALDSTIGKLDADRRTLTEPGVTDDRLNEVRARRGLGGDMAATTQAQSTGPRLTETGLESEEQTVTSRLDQGTARTVRDTRRRTLTPSSLTDERKVASTVVTGAQTTTTTVGRSRSVQLTGGELAATSSRTASASSVDAATGESSSTTRKQSRSIGTSGFGTSSEQSERRGSQLESRSSSRGVERGGGQIGVKATSASTSGTVDSEGTLLTGTTTKQTVSGGVIAGPGQAGVGVKAGRESTQTHAPGVTTGQSVTLDGKVLVTCQEVPGSSPPRYRVGLTISLGGGLTVSAGAEKKAVADASAGGSAGVSVTASGSLTQTFTQLMSEEETAAYLGAVRDHKAYGAYRELKVIELAAHGSTQAAQALLAHPTGQLATGADLRSLTEGQEVETTAAGTAGGSASLGGTSSGGASAGVKLGYTVSGSIARTVSRENGKIIIKLEVIKEGTGVLGVSFAPGVTSMGISGTRGTLTGEAVTFTLDPRDPKFDARAAQIQVTNSVEGLRAFASANPDLVTSSTLTTGTSSSTATTAGLAGVSLELETSSSLTEAVTTDQSGVTKKITASSAAGAGVSLPGGVKLASKTTDTFTGKLGPDQKASGEAATTRSETDFGRSAAALTEAPIATVTAAVTGTGSVLKQRAETTGTKVDDADYQRLMRLAADSDEWTRVFASSGGLVIDAFEDWTRTRTRILEAGGDREAIVRALAEYQAGGSGRGPTVQAAFKSAGAGIRFDFPDVLSDQKPVYDELVVGDPVAAAQVLSNAGKRAEALDKLGNDLRRLTAMQAAIQARQAEVSDPSVLVEMLRRIGDRAALLRAASASLAAPGPAPAAARPAVAGRAGGAQARPPGPAGQSGQAGRQEAAPALAEAAAQERTARIDMLTSACRTFQGREKQIFTAIDEMFTHWSSLSNVIFVSERLTELTKMYQEWYPVVAQLRAAYAEGGEPGSRADQFGPDRAGWERRSTHLHTW
jgi:Domain of unknown function (DUF4157)